MGGSKGWSGKERPQNDGRVRVTGLRSGPRGRDLEREEGNIVPLVKKTTPFFSKREVQRRFYQKQNKEMTV